MCKRERELDRHLSEWAVDDRVHVLHRRLNPEEKQPNLTVAYVIVHGIGEPSPYQAIYQTAHRSPVDNFCRRIGRLISKGRLEKQEAGSVPLGNFPNSKEDWRELDDTVVMHYLNQYNSG